MRLGYCKNSTADSNFDATQRDRSVLLDYVHLLWDKSIYLSSSNVIAASWLIRNPMPGKCDKRYQDYINPRLPKKEENYIII